MGGSELQTIREVVMAAAFGAAQPEETRDPFSKTRIEALSDGIFSVALTILIIPLTDNKTIREIYELGLWGTIAVPSVLSFLFSLPIIGMYWLLTTMNST
jgi:uncharacterized membrane protein